MLKKIILLASLPLMVTACSKLKSVAALQTSSTSASLGTTNCISSQADQTTVLNSTDFFITAQTNSNALAAATECLINIKSETAFLAKQNWSCDSTAHVLDYINICKNKVSILISQNSSQTCPVLNGTGQQTWDSNGWSSCQISQCASGFVLLNGSCQPQVCNPNTTQNCAVANGSGSQICNVSGTAWGQCSAALFCTSGFNLQGGTCVANVCAPNSQQSCSANNGTGTQSCNSNGSAFLSCGSPTSCDSGFHLQNNSCVQNICSPQSQETCGVANGAGLQACNSDGSSYGACRATSCNSGFVLNNGSCAAFLNPGLDGKFLVGYQGWFSAQGDGDPYTTPTNSWSHWSQWQTGAPNFGNTTVEMWPDVSEYSQLYPTAFTLQDGSPAKVFSSYDFSTVLTHFKWMQQYGIDGAVLQRFTVSKQFGPDYQTFTAQVARNTVNAAQATDRVFCVLIDTAGDNVDSIVQNVINEWQYDVNTLHLTDSPNYLRHNGKPVVYLAQFGIYSHAAPTVDQAAQIIQFFKNAGVTVVGETPAYWRTLDHDSQTDPRWLDIYHSYDVINPWTVGTYQTQSQIDDYINNVVVGDLADTAAHGQQYMPVIYPGFSRSNLCGQGNTNCPEGVNFNVIPRQGGQFWWKQAYQYKKVGIRMMYAAMFDEVDEGTAIFKIAPTQKLTPAQTPFLSLDADGFQLPSDWYLQLARQTAAMLKGQIGLSQSIPLQMPASVAAPTNPNAQMLYSRGSLSLHSDHYIQRSGFVLYMQNDGNLVLKDPNGANLWSSGTAGLCMSGQTYQDCLVVYQDDGNLVIYNTVTGAAQSLGGYGSSALLFNREISTPLLFE